MEQIKRLVLPKNYEKFDRKIVDKQFLMGKFYQSTITSLISPACRNKHKNIKKFPKSKTRKLLEEQLKIQKKLQGKEKQQELAFTNYYEFYLPLHNLWNRYITDLISKEQNQQTRQSKILRSDFHGALITVLHSKNKYLVGLGGIVISQTLKTFQIITKVEVQHHPNTKTRKIILKQICVFLLQITNTDSYIINGNNLVYRPTDRLKHKFKFKKADKINHDFLKIINEVAMEERQEQSNMEIGI